MNKTMKLIAAAAALGAAVPAFAKIEVGNNPELALVVFDDVNKVSFTKDLGTFADAFKTQFDGHSKAASLSWNVSGDANWDTFLGVANVSNLKWTVLGWDDIGGTAVGQKRLFTTALNTPKNLAAIPNWTNQQFTNAISAGQLGTFFGQLNVTGTHGTLANGSSVNFDTDVGNAYFGQPGSGEFYNGISTFSNANAVGQSSEFFYLTRSGTNQLNKVLVDRFESVGGVASTFTFSNQGGNAVLMAAAVPEPSTYAMLLGGLLALGLVVRRRTNERR
ncbi:MAG: PEP-CTERM sorting domain-containing protein [Roseateles asaccharophilus]|uniref:Putative secreted protein with PEP-CTERM sorting signal n=1 Tax=Roseateles asaccharophilus TaxID=582607 RepID=A0A4R6MT37_9BURK|nr:PEP-CTERM sorting domain-containing protein [Roseateles asaccharophilus]MDN3546475.1 PEP-CTERM sorting domain-containing protein [Roseateles asaccharophilus]TDP05515.1 putative secreted protein with PEP-CTERM sorting signal [Roseateles asaccharophilus]